MIVYLSAFVAVIGLFLFVSFNMADPASPRTKTIAEIGRIMFGCGVLVFLLLAPRILQVLR